MYETGIRKEKSPNIKKKTYKSARVYFNLNKKKNKKKTTKNNEYQTRFIIPRFPRWTWKLYAFRTSSRRILSHEISW